MELKVSKLVCSRCGARFERDEGVYVEGYAVVARRFKVRDRTKMPSGKLEANSVRLLCQTCKAEEEEEQERLLK